MVRPSVVAGRAAGVDDVPLGVRGVRVKDLSRPSEGMVTTRPPDGTTGAGRVEGGPIPSPFPLVRGPWRTGDATGGVRVVIAIVFHFILAFRSLRRSIRTISCRT